MRQPALNATHVAIVLPQLAEYDKPPAQKSVPVSFDNFGKENEMPVQSSVTAEMVDDNHEDAEVQAEELVRIQDWKTEQGSGENPSDLALASAIACEAIRHSMVGRSFCIGVLTAEEFDNGLQVPEGTSKALVSLGIGPQHVLGVDQQPVFRLKDVSSWLTQKANREGLKAFVAAASRLRPSGQQEAASPSRFAG